jgi:hypothetical protein
MLSPPVYERVLPVELLCLARNSAIHLHAPGVDPGGEQNLP